MSEVISVKVVADTSQAQQQINTLKQSLQTLSAKPIDINNQSLLEASKAAAELQKNLQAATNVNTGKLDLSVFASQMQKSNQSISSYAQHLSAFGKEGRDAFRQLAASISQADLPVTQLSQKLQKFGQTLKNTITWQISSSMIHGVMGAYSSAIGYAKDLNESLNNIRIVTGASTDQMARFADQANKAAKALSTTTTKYTDAALIYYQQGLDDKQVQQRTDITVKMANAAGISAQVASDQLTAIWNNFDNGSQSLEHYADVLVKLGAETASSSDEISQGMEKFAAIANTVGLSYEYAAAALATVTATTRQSADTVGTAFKTLFARLEGLQLGETLEDGTTLNKYSQALATVGVNIKDAAGQMKSMDTIIDELGSKWQSLGKDQQIALAQTVGGMRQYSQFIALMDQFDYFKENVGRAQNADGTLQSQADIYAESWEAASQRLKASMEDIFDSLMDDKAIISFINGLTKIADTIANVVDGLGGLKGLLLTISTIFLSKYKQQIPGVVSELGQTFNTVFRPGYVARQAQNVQSSALTELQRQQGYARTNQERAQYQTQIDDARLNATYLNNARRMSDREKAAFRQRQDDLRFQNKMKEQQGARLDENAKNISDSRGAIASRNMDPRIFTPQQKIDAERALANANNLPTGSKALNVPGISEEEKERQIAAAQANLNPIRQYEAQKKLLNGAEPIAYGRTTSQHRAWQQQQERMSQPYEAAIRKSVREQNAVDSAKIARDSLKGMSSPGQGQSKTDWVKQVESAVADVTNQKVKDAVAKLKEKSQSGSDQEVEAAFNELKTEIAKEVRNATERLKTANKNEEAARREYQTATGASDGELDTFAADVMEDEETRIDHERRNTPPPGDGNNPEDDPARDINSTISNVATAMMSAATIYTATAGAVQVLGDESANAAAKITAVVSGLGAVAMSASQLGSVFTSLAGPSGMIGGLSGGVWGIIASIAITAISAAITTWQNHQAEKEARLEEKYNAQKEKSENVQKRSESNKQLLNEYESQALAYQKMSEAVAAGEAPMSQLLETQSQLAIKAKEVAEAYNMQGAAIGVLSGNAEAFNKQLDNAREKELKDEKKTHSETLSAIEGKLLRTKTDSGGKFLDSGATLTDERQVAAILSKYDSFGQNGMMNTADTTGHYKSVKDALQTYDDLVAAKAEMEKSLTDDELKESEIYGSIQKEIQLLQGAVELYREYSSLVDSIDTELAVLSDKDALKGVTDLKSFDDYRQKTIDTIAAEKGYLDETGSVIKEKQADYETLVSVIDEYLGTIPQIAEAEVGNLSLINEGIDELVEYASSQFENFDAKKAKDAYINLFNEYGNAIFDPTTGLQFIDPREIQKLFTKKEGQIVLEFNKEKIDDNLESILDLLKIKAEQADIQVKISAIEEFDPSKDGINAQSIRELKKGAGDAWDKYFGEGFSTSDFMLLSSDEQTQAKYAMKSSLDGAYQANREEEKIALQQRKEAINEQKDNSPDYRPSNGVLESYLEKAVSASTDTTAVAIEAAALGIQAEQANTTATVAAGAQAIVAAILSQDVDAKQKVQDAEQVLADKQKAQDQTQQQAEVIRQAVLSHKETRDLAWQDFADAEAAYNENPTKKNEKARDRAYFTWQEAAQQYSEVSEAYLDALVANGKAGEEVQAAKEEWEQATQEYHSITNKDAIEALVPDKSGAAPVVSSVDEADAMAAVTEATRDYLAPLFTSKEYKAGDGNEYTPIEAIDAYLEAKANGEQETMEQLQNLILGIMEQKEDAVFDKDGNFVVLTPEVLDILREGLAEGKAKDAEYDAQGDLIDSQIAEIEEEQEAMADGGALQNELESGAAALNLDVEQVKAYTEALLQAEEALDAVTAAKIAEAYLSQKKGVENLKKSWDDYTAQAEDSLDKTVALEGVFSDLEQAIGLPLDPLVKDMLKTEKGMKKLEAAAKGDTKALKEIQKAARKADFARTLAKGAEDSEAALAKLNKDGVDSFLDSLDKVEVKTAYAADNIKTEMQSLGSLFNDVMSGIEPYDAGQLIDDTSLVAKCGALLDTLYQYTQDIDTAIAAMAEYGIEVKETDPVEMETSITGSGAYVGVHAENRHFDDIHYVQLDPVETSINQTTSGKVKGFQFFKKGDTPSGGSGGGGGGGGGQKPKPPKPHKRIDPKVRYEGTKKQIDNLSHKQEHASEKKEAMYGKEKIKQIEREIELKQRQIKLQTKYVEETKNALELQRIDVAAAFKELEKYGIKMPALEFDVDGSISNLDKIEEALLRFENYMIDMENAGANEFFMAVLEELFDTAREGFDNLLEIIEDCLDAANEFWEALNELAELNLEKITIEVEMNLAIAEADLEYIDYMLEKLGDEGYNAADAIAEMGAKAENAMSQIKIAATGIEKILEGRGLTVEDLITMDADDLLGLGFRQDEVDQLLEWRSIIIENMGTLNELRQESIDQLSASFDLLSEELETQIGLFEHYSELLEHFGEIATLTGSRFAKSELRSIIQMMNEAAIINGQANIRSAKSHMDIMQQKLDDFMAAYATAKIEAGKDPDDIIPQWEETRKNMEEALRESQEAFYAAWEDTLDKATDILEQWVEDAGARFDEALSPIYQSLDRLEEAYDRMVQKDENYYDNFEQLYHLSKLTRDITNSIDDTDNIKGKQRLKDLLKEITDIQARGVELSEYDVDILRKRYELEQARQKLEDAEDNASLVRLQRDQEGNWGYVYTADEDAVKEAEQEYEDKLYELQKANDEYINELQERILELTTDCKEQLAEIAEDATLSPEEKQRLSQEILDFYNSQLEYITSQMDGALSNQSSTLGLMLSIYKTSNDSLVDTWRETNLSLIGLYKNTDEMFAGLTNQMVNYFGDLWQGIIDFDNNLNNINIAAGATDIVQMLSKEIAGVGESAGQAEEDLAKLEKRFGTMFDEAISQITIFEEKYRSEIDSVIDKNEELVQSLLRVVSILALVNSDDAEFQAAYDEYNAAQQKHLEGLGREVTIGDIRYSLARTNDPEWEAAKAKFDEFMTNWMRKHSGGIMDTGESYDTGGYTGEWGPEGKLAWLHQKELVLNAGDTENLLDALGFVKTIELSLNSFASMLSNLVPSILHMEDKEPIVQEVNITAEFPNVESHNEIEEAFNNLLNDAAQYALSRE